MGCYFPVNLAMLQTKKARKLVQSLPMDRIQTETDGPFADSVSKPCRPVELTPTRDGLAAALGLSDEETSELVSRNLGLLLS